MKLVYQLLLFVATLSFTQHFQNVQGQLMNFGFVDRIRSLVRNVLHLNPQGPSDPSQYNATTYYPMAQTSESFVSNYIPISSEGIQQQGEISTLPQDSVNGTVEETMEARHMINAPLINGKCEDGYKSFKGRCMKTFGRRR